MKKKVATLTTLAVLSSPFILEASAESYVVKKGDTLYSIAKNNATTVAELKKLNSLSTDLIFPNQQLVLSKKQTSDNISTSSVSNSTTNKKTATRELYTVVKGDTLIKIANQHGISLAELTVWNNISGHLIYPGQKFYVSQPDGGNQNTGNHTQSNDQTVTNPPSTPPTASVSEYRIKSGDTLSKIARQFGLTVQELKTMNHLTSDLIFPGQVLSVKPTNNGKLPANKNEQNQKNKNNQTNPKGSTVVQNAQKVLGSPYLWGGVTPDGFDCSGFIYYVFTESNQPIGRYSTEGYYNRSYYINNPSPGDLVFFENTYKKGISHMGIYIGDNKFIHSENRGVIITDLNNSYYKKRFDGFKRFY